MKREERTPKVHLFPSEKNEEPQESQGSTKAKQLPLPTRCALSFAQDAENDHP